MLRTANTQTDNTESELHLRYCNNTHFYCLESSTSSSTLVPLRLYSLFNIKQQKHNN